MLRARTWRLAGAVTGGMLSAVALLCMVRHSSSAQVAPSPAFLAIENGVFVKDGKGFSIRATCCDPAVGHWFLFRGPWIEAGLGHCRQYGFNAIRTWVPGTGGREDAATYGAWLQDRDAFYREFDRVFVERCKAEGAYLILTLTELPASAGPGSRYDVDSEAYAAWRRFAEDFCGHYKDEPWILFWEVANEYRGDPENLAGTRRFYERAARDLREIDPNHLISSGVDGFHWQEVGNSYNVWLNINTTPGVDIASSHVYANDEWTYNWHTERDYVRMVAEEAAAAARVGKPLFLGEFGAEPRLRQNGENPEIIWYMKAIIRQGIQAYGLHWIYPEPQAGLFNVVPQHSPRTMALIKELNAFAAEGRQVPADFGPRTTDYAFPICNGARPFAGPPPLTRGPATAEADERSFGRAAPSLRITWQAGGAAVELGPFHPNDLSEYGDAGGALRLSIRSNGGLPGGLRVTVGDEAGATASSDLSEAPTVGGPGAGWTRARIPMAKLPIDWTRWMWFRLELPGDTAGSLNVDDIEVACGDGAP